MFQDLLVFMQAVVAVIVVCVIAYLFIRFGLRPAYRGRSSGKVKLLDRMPMDSKGSATLLLVEVGDKVLLLGVTQGSINLIKEMSHQELGLDGDEEWSESALEKVPFADLLSKWTGKKTDTH